MLRSCMNCFFGAVILLSTGHPAGAKSASDRDWKFIAWSERLGVEIFAKEIDGRWCHQANIIRLSVQEATLDERASQDLIAKLGNKMLNDCRHVRYLAVEVFSTASNKVTYRGEAMASDGWLLTPLTTQLENQSSPSSDATSFPAELDVERVRVSDLVSIAISAQSAARASGRIAQLQVFLKHLGFYAGAADGELNQHTRNGIQAFQLASSIDETGKPDQDFFQKATDPTNLRNIMEGERD